LIIPDHALGLPVLRALSLCACCRHYPGAAAGDTASLVSPSRISLPRKGDRVGLRIVLFEDCSAFTRVTACTLAKSPFVTRCIEGFSHFVTSMTSPITSGGSNRRVGLSPTGKAPPYHGAHPMQTVASLRSRRTESKKIAERRGIDQPHPCRACPHASWRSSQYVRS